jgi:hypothetical protein
VPEPAPFQTADPCGSSSCALPEPTVSTPQKPQCQGSSCPMPDPLYRQIAGCWNPNC